MLETQKKRSDPPPRDTQSDIENADEQRDEQRKEPTKDPTRYGDWEVGGRCIDF